MARSRKVSNFVINKGLTKAELDEAYLAGQITDDQLSVVDTIETVIPDPTGNAGKFLTTDGTDAQWATISTNIEWETKVDLPADHPLTWGVAPYYVVQGGLPDGEYEFYFSTKCTDSSDMPLGETIFKVDIKIDNTTRTVWGNAGYVFNGDYVNDENTIFGTENRYFYMFRFNTSNNDFIMYTNEVPFATNAAGYQPTRYTITDCFKLSAIVNKSTGQKYIATGSLTYDGPMNTYGGYAMLRRIASQPFVPVQHATDTWNVNVQDARYGCMVFSVGVSTGNLRSATSFIQGSFEFEGYPGEFSFTIENRVSSYIAKIQKATGVFANTVLGHVSPSDSAILVKFNAELIANTNLKSSVGYAGSADSVSFGWNTLDTFVPLVITEVGGTVDTTNLGTILQYDKETNQDYTNGYFYKANGTITQVPDSWDIEYISLSDVTLSIDTNTLVQGLVALTGNNSNYIRSYLLKNYKNWQIRYDVDSDVVTSIWWQYWGEIVLQDVLDAFTVTATGYTGYINVQTTMSLVAAHEEVQNGYWERINTQPEGDVIQVDTMPAAIDTPTGKVVQYVGTTSGGYTNGYFYKNNIVVTPESASISQTSGSGLTDLAVNLNTFVSEEQPSGSETVDFVCNSTPEDIIFGTTSGFSCYSTDNGASLRAFLSSTEPTDAWLQGTFWYNNYNNTFVLYDTDNKGILGLSVEEWAAYNIIITTDNPGYGATLTYEFVGGTYWTKSGSQVNPTDYGITYTGTPADQDILTVAYTAPSSSGGWDRIDVQPQGDSLPSQTGQSGKFLTTDGTNASWSDKPLVNKDTSSGGTGIGIGGSAADLAESVRIGVGATAPASFCTVVGYNATAKYLGTALGNRSQAAGWGVAIGNGATNSDYTSSVAIGNGALSSGNRAIAIGGFAQATADYSVLINASGDTATNNVAGSIMFSNRYNNAQHTYELVSADGTIPEARLADTTSASSGQVLSLDSNLNAVWTTPAAGGVTDVEVNGTSVVSGGVASITITDELPSQSGNAGKFLTTDGTDVSWSDKPLVNGTTVSTSLAILGDVKPGTYSYGNYAIGGTIGISSAGNRNTAIGNGSLVYSNNAQCATAIGSGARCYNGQGVAIGANMYSNAEYAIQLGGHYNSVSNNDTKTFKVYNGNGNYTMMSADGTIPTDRFTTTPSADGTYVPTLTISSGVATRTWGAAPSGGSVPTLTWYTVSTAGTTLTIADTSSAQLVKIYKNGLLLQPTEDYTISGTTLTTVAALVVGDKITTEVF